jgi:hypothetical protein
MRPNLRLSLSLAALSVSLLASSTAFASSICDAVTGNLITDCGFENAVGTSTATGFSPWWTLSANSNFSVVVNAVPGNYFVNSGTNAAALGDIAATSLTSSTFADTAGKTYNFSFYLYGDTGAPGSSSFEALVDGTAVTLSEGGSVVGTAFDDTTAAYELFTTSFVGTGGSANTVSFDFFDSTGTNGYLFLDDVTVVPAAVAPEPSTLALLLIGSLGLFAIARRRLLAPSAQPMQLP